MTMMMTQELELVQELGPELEQVQEPEQHSFLTVKKKRFS